MSMKFFCTIHEPIKGGYKILLNGKNINFLPGEKTTLRRIFINAELDVGDTLYVNDGELGEGGKLVVREAYKLSLVPMLPAPKAEPKVISDQVKAMIACADTQPIELFQLCLTE